MVFSAPTNGMSRADLIAELGEPRGVGGNSKFEMLSFDGGVIELTKGKVSKIPEDFGKQPAKLDTKGFSGLWEKILSLLPSKKGEADVKPADVSDELEPVPDTISPEAQALMDASAKPSADKNQKVEDSKPDTGSDNKKNPPVVPDDTGN